jgi:hypothetical protein
VRFLQVDIDGFFGFVDYGISRLPLNVPICGRDCLLHGTGICGWLAVDRSCNASTPIIGGIVLKARSQLRVVMPRSSNVYSASLVMALGLAVSVGRRIVRGK